jgi:hypothetical protein
LLPFLYECGVISQQIAPTRRMNLYDKKIQPVRAIEDAPTRVGRAAALT